MLAFHLDQFRQGSLHFSPYNILSCQEQAAHNLKISFSFFECNPGSESDSEMKKSLHEQVPNGQLIPVKIGAVKPHIRYHDFHEILPLIDYAMTASNCMTREALSFCLTIHPVVVIGAKTKTTGRYICVAGLRTLNLAASILGTDEQISALFLERPRKEDIDLIVSADILFSHLLFSVKKPENLGKLFAQMPLDHVNDLLIEGARSKIGFARQTSYSYNSLFTHQSKGIR